MIFWCCCSVTAVSALRCFSVNSKTTAFSKCPSVCGGKTKVQLLALCLSLMQPKKKPQNRLSKLFFLWCRDLTDSFRCSGNRSFSWPIHSLILSLLFFSINRCGNLYASCWHKQEADALKHACICGGGGKSCCIIHTNNLSLMETTN